jgi:hypothetical protein
VTSHQQQVHGTSRDIGRALILLGLYAQDWDRFSEARLSMSGKDAVSRADIVEVCDAVQGLQLRFVVGYGSFPSYGEIRCKNEAESQDLTSDQEEKSLTETAMTFEQRN